MNIQLSNPRKKNLQDIVSSFSSFTISWDALQHKIITLWKNKNLAHIRLLKPCKKRTYGTKKTCQLTRFLILHDTIHSLVTLEFYFTRSKYMVSDSSSPSTVYVKVSPLRVTVAKTHSLSIKSYVLSPLSMRSKSNVISFPIRLQV